MNKIFAGVEASIPADAMESGLEEDENEAGSIEDELEDGADELSQLVRKIRFNWIFLNENTNNI